jgi:tRNA threonylcarbamoyladenosine dehydratase
VTTTQAADLERRFGGLRRLYGDADYARLRALRVAVVGLGGVGSWAVEALARCGVASLTLIDMDHVAESNVNRQIQATDDTLGMAKVDALASRVAIIHPGCEVRRIDAFVDADNWPALLQGQTIDALIDACDQTRAKLVLARWAVEQAGVSQHASVRTSERAASGLAFVCVGAAGGKRDATAVDVSDLADVTHDPLLASLRQRLRKDVGARAGQPLHVRCVHSREAVRGDASGGSGAGFDAHDAPGVDAPDVDAPDADAGGPNAESERHVESARNTSSATSRILSGTPSIATRPVQGGLNCAGYGSSVMVTAAFGMAAAGELVRQAMAAKRHL